jgi:HAD superfamily hydrolase (TIGR01450 family)
MPSLAVATDGLLIDLDGCLLSGGQPAEGAPELVRAYGDRLAIVSNNSTDTPEEMAVRLAAIGLTIPPHRIILAGAVAADMIAEERPQARVLALAGAGLRTYMSRRGLRLVDDMPDLVFVARDIDFSYRRLHAAVRALSSGAGLIAANPDDTHPDEDGIPVPETGVLVAALSAAVPSARPRYIGKPGAALFRAALGVLDAVPERTVMIGDNPDTDGAGAARLGIPCVIIGPDFTLADLLQMAA